MITSSLFPPFPNFLLVILAFLLSGCGALTGLDLMAERYMACPLDSVWASSIETLKPYPITEKNKDKGVIETGWRVEYVRGREYGLFKREGMGDKERSQLTLTMTPMEKDVVRLRLAERRQHWGFRGGSRLYDWYPVQPSQIEVNRLLENLEKKLEAEGCFIES